MKLLETMMDVCEKTSENLVGKPIQVGERTLIPIITLSCFYNKLGTRRSGKSPQAGGFLITPLAFVVIDPQCEWVLPIQEKEISMSYLTKDVPGLADKIKEARENQS
jgi:uncharacterized spore protein YtfJ